jgi:DNA-binding SARP family transcriptional activator
LATLFWPDADQQTGRASLRRTVYNLKKVVGEKTLAVMPETIGMHPDADPWVDVAIFQSHATLSEGSAETDEAVISRLTEAAQLYCGDFMAGCHLADCPEFDEWQFIQPN